MTESPATWVSANRLIIRRRRTASARTIRSSSSNLFPSRSFPDAELVIVVRRNDTALYEHLQRAFAGVARVKVIVDRGVGDRRSSQWPVPDERRRMRMRRIRQGTLSPFGGYTVERFTPKATTPPR